jgi:hypothetical protein
MCTTGLTGPIEDDGRAKPAAGLAWPEAGVHRGSVPRAHPEGEDRGRQ